MDEADCVAKVKNRPKTTEIIIVSDANSKNSFTQKKSPILAVPIFIRPSPKKIKPIAKIRGTKRYITFSFDTLNKYARPIMLSNK